MWSLTLLTTMIVTARIYIRAKIVRNIGPDDWLIMVAVVSCGMRNSCLSIS